MWNPEQYGKFGEARSRPFFDLLAQVSLANPRHIADLGCGPGALTVFLAERWPRARVWGVDTSQEMLERAEAYAIPGRLGFVKADLSSWEPPERLDLLVSSATLQWVPDHEALIPHLASLVRDGGALAFAVPGNFTAPSHALLAGLRQSPRWRDKLGEGAVRELAVKELGWYFETLTSLGMKVNAWETTYLHVLTGEDAVLEWTKGTALRPVLEALDEDEREAFVSEYGALLREAYPRRAYGTLLPFRRLFVVAYAGSPTLIDARI
jgi:trans-aconitate 2-methyltransferase